MLDDVELERVENLRRVINRPKKHHEPVLVPDKPWEAEERVQAWGSVIQEPDGLLRMWYFAYNEFFKHNRELDRGGFAYAESRDGIHWEKPDLGIVDFRGSKKNNLFYTCSPDGKLVLDRALAAQGRGLPTLDEQGRPLGVISNIDGMTVIRDDDDPDPQRRYKMFGNMNDHRMWAAFPTVKAFYPGVTDAEIKAARETWGQYYDTSPDGIHWTHKPRRMIPAVGDYMMMARDYRHQRWWLNERTNRNAQLRTSRDLVNWSERENCFDNTVENGRGKTWQWHGGMTPFNYGNQNVGFLEKWPVNDFGACCELISHRDGQPWQRVFPGTPFLDVGPEGAFDRTLIYPTHNPPIRIGDKLLIYYTGGGVLQAPGKDEIPMAIGVATIGLDRFAGLASWYTEAQGKVITKPVRVGKSKLEINVESLRGFPLRIGVSMPDGRFLPGFEPENSRVTYDAAQIYSPVRWQDQADLSALQGNLVVLHIELRGAILYSYRFC